MSYELMLLIFMVNVVNCRLFACENLCLFVIVLVLILDVIQDELVVAQREQSHIP